MDAASLYLVGKKLAVLAEPAMASPEGLPAEPTMERSPSSSTPPGGSGPACSRPSSWSTSSLFAREHPAS
ncbi:MAG TPA: hypothetical protein VGB85_28570 [Nannocystis sp.]|jgi:hypothetical protein